MFLIHFFLWHYVNTSVLINLCHILVIDPSYILSVKENQMGIKIGYFSTINRNIVKQANIMFMNTCHRFPAVLLYSRCKLHVCTEMFPLYVCCTVLRSTKIGRKPLWSFPRTVNRRCKWRLALNSFDRNTTTSPTPTQILIRIPGLLQLS